MAARAHKTLPFTGSGDTGLSILSGFAIEENASPAGAARVLFRKGSGEGDVIIPLRLAAEESAALTLPNEVEFGAPVYIDVVVGTVRGSVWGR